MPEWEADKKEDLVKHYIEKISKKRGYFPFDDLFNDALPKVIQEPRFASAVQYNTIRVCLYRAVSDPEGLVRSAEIKALGGDVTFVNKAADLLSTVYNYKNEPIYKIKEKLLEVRGYTPEEINDYLSLAFVLLDKSNAFHKEVHRDLRAN